MVFTHFTPWFFKFNCVIFLAYVLNISSRCFNWWHMVLHCIVWVIPHTLLLPMSCSYLKDRLQAICPPCLASFYLVQQPKTSSPVYLLKFCCLDRKGLLHGNIKYSLHLKWSSSIWYVCIFDCVVYIVVWCCSRCNRSPVWAWTYNSEGESDYNPGWKSFGPLFHNR